MQMRLQHVETKVPRRDCLFIRVLNYALGKHEKNHIAMKHTLYTVFMHRGH